MYTQEDITDYRNDMQSQPGEHHLPTQIRFHLSALSNRSVATHPSIKNKHPLDPSILLVQYSRQYSGQIDPPATPSADQDIFAVLDENGCPFWRGVDGGDDIATGLGWEGWPALCEARCGHYRASWRENKDTLLGGNGDG